jgi:hypothetical protein
MKTKYISRACLFLVGFYIVTLQSAQPADSGPFAQLRLATSRVPGWTEQKEQYQFFTAEELYGIIDGGAAEHQKQGLKSGIGLFLTGGTKSLGIYFEDFGTPSRAKGMVSMKKKSLSTPEIIPQVKVSPAIYEEVIGGCIAFWAKGHYYVEMTLTGYDSTKYAVRDAVVLIDSISPIIVK